MTVAPDPAEARRGGRVLAGAVIGGLALGALAATTNRSYGYGYGNYGGPRYYGSSGYYGGYGYAPRYRSGYYGGYGGRGYDYYRPTSYYYGGFAPVRSGYRDCW